MKRKRFSPLEKKADQHVANRFRARRLELHLTQMQLAEALRLSHQQVQKMEYGHDRITAGRLYLCCEVLKVPVMYFFEGLEP